MRINPCPHCGNPINIRRLWQTGAFNYQCPACDELSAVRWPSEILFAFVPVSVLAVGFWVVIAFRPNPSPARFLILVPFAFVGSFLKTYLTAHLGHFRVSG